MLSPLFLFSALIKLSSSENILSKLRDDVFYQYDADVIPREVSAGRLKCFLTVYLLRMGRTANLLMSTWVWLPPGLTWTATVELFFPQNILTWPDLTAPLHTGVLSLALWLKMSWRDHRLAWDPQYYDNINIIRLEVTCHHYGAH